MPFLLISLPLFLPSSPSESPFKTVLCVVTEQDTAVTHVRNAMFCESSLNNLVGLLCLMLFVCSWSCGVLPWEGKDAGVRIGILFCSFIFTLDEGNEPCLSHKLSSDSVTEPSDSILK